MPTSTGSKAIAVYCGSSLGKQQAFANAASSVGRALAAQNRPLIYGGGMKGLMGIVADAVMKGEGKVTGIIPYALYAAGGERDKSTNAQNEVLEPADSAKMQTIIVDSMHERKVEMAKRSMAFIGLPGGFGTFEEVFEVTTWTQLAVVLLNVLSYYNPLRQLIENGIDAGFISPSSRNLIVFVDGPSTPDEHEIFDWGTAALDAIGKWQGSGVQKHFDWTQRKDGSASGALCST
ncbi:putative cytokinin riboside 5'-monophosphate phosphoribohydrolase LOGL2 [Termitomyces sp. T112]|nr:putative cytokinin riboside 5'-monophosphate phosphoribohydrolase LOGL2 [Termitomyces sp. T112]